MSTSFAPHPRVELASAAALPTELRCDCRKQLERGLRQIATMPCGVLLQEEGLDGCFGR